MKKALIKGIAGRMGKSQKDADAALKAVIDSINDELMTHGSVRVIGLGTFKVKTRKARTARNPRTGEAVQVEENYTITLSIDSKARAVATATAAFARFYAKENANADQ